MRHTVEEGTGGGDNDEERSSGKPQSEPLPPSLLQSGTGEVSPEQEPRPSRLTLGATVPGTTLGAASVAGVGGIEAYERLAINDALAVRVCAGRTARAVRDAVGTARRSAEVAGTPRERVAIQSCDQFLSTKQKNEAIEHVAYVLRCLKDMMPCFE